MRRITSITFNKPYFSVEKLFIFLFAFFSLRSVWLAFDNPILFVPIGYLCIPLGMFVLAYYYNFQIEAKDFKLLLLPCVYWLFGYLHPAGEYKVMFDLLNLLITCTYLLLPTRLKILIFRCFYWLVQIQNIISVLIYICYFANIPIGFEKVLFYGSRAEEQGLYYIKWHSFAIYNEFIVFFRLCGIFNEPGALGTLCALLFIVIYNNSKFWEKLLLFITGALTLSFAFFVLIGLYLFINYSKKNPKIILSIFVLVPLIFVIPKIDWGNETLNNFASRFEITENGLKANNRTTDEFDVKFENFKNSEFAYFGYGQGKTLANHSLSYKQYLVWFGYIGAGLLALLWFVNTFLYSYKDKDCLIFILLFMLSIYQRPAAIIQIFGYIVLFGGMSWIQKKRTEKNEAV